jgi:uncharacterized membrane protein
MAMDRNPRPLTGAGLLLGAGMGGFVDGIVFHQILQWHNMLSGWLPPTNLVDAKANMFFDGLFHAGVWLLTAAGLWRLWAAARRPEMPGSARLFLGSGLAGWGLFNVVEGLVDHLVLGVHHVNEYAPDPLGWDLAFLASGVLFIALGWLLGRRACEP